MYQYGCGTDIGISVILVSVKASYVWSPDNISIGIGTNIRNIGNIGLTNQYYDCSELKGALKGAIYISIIHTYVAR